MDNTFATIYIILSSGGILVLGLALLYLQKTLNRTRAEKQRIETEYRRLAEQSETMELPSIEAKLNPHLFKNILNSIQSHAFQTYYALDKMADVLDYILYESNKGLVTPREEIDFALNLIEINKVKISPLFALTIKQKIDENDAVYRQKVMAPLLSVDLIENAFKHADLQKNDSFITIIFEMKNGIFSLTVVNKISSRSALRKEKSGLGSSTFEQRLQILYKGHYTLERQTDNDTYTAHLTIDLNEKAAEMSAS